MNTPRFAAVKALCEVDRGGYSNIVLNSVLSEYSLTSRDKALSSALFYGVLDRKITIDFVLKKLLTKNVRIKPATKNAIRIGIYQIMYMDKIPESAAVNESVNLVKASKDKSSASFVNAILRNTVRLKAEILPQDNSLESLSVRYSCPVSIISSYLSDYGIDDTVFLLEHSLKSPKIYLRVNTLRTSCEQLIQLLNERGIKANLTNLPDSLILDNGFAVFECDLYKQGLYHVQDLSSQICSVSLDAKDGEEVLDVCSAPGGKAFTIAQCMNNTGRIVACDIHKHRVDLIDKSAQRLGITNISTLVCDSSVYNDNLGTFDKVLCDVPCSGLGVISRKPEIKYAERNFDDLPQIQLNILTSSAKHLKKGGRICYSTCTLRKAENEYVCEKFVSQNSDFKIISSKTYMPHKDGTDGFFICIIERR